MTRSEKYNIDHRILRPDGSILWVNAQAELEYDDKGSPAALVGTIWDMTEGKRGEEALSESAARHQSILHTVMDGFLRLDSQGCLPEVNQAYCRMSGYGEQELLTMSLFDLAAAETVADTTTHIQKIMAGG